MGDIEYLVHIISRAREISAHKKLPAEIAKKIDDHRKVVERALNRILMGKAQQAEHERPETSLLALAAVSSIDASETDKIEAALERMFNA